MPPLLLRGLAFSALLLSALAPAAAQDAPAGASDSLRSLTILGNESFGEKEVFEAAGHDAPSRIPFLRGSWRTTRAEARRVLEEVLLFYRRNGYFDVRADLEFPKPDRAVISVREGLPCLVRGITLLRIDEDGTVSRLPAGPDGRILLHVGRPFTVAAYEGSSSLLEAEWKNSGFPFAEVELRADIDPASRSASILYRIRPGPFAVFGPTEFLGIIHTEEAILRRAIAYREGDPYCQRRVDETLAELYRLALFDSVVVKARRKSPPGVALMRIRLKEGRHRRVRIGLGYGTEDHFRYRVQWSTLRMADRIVTLGTHVRASAIETSSTVFFRRPYFLDRDTTLLAESTYGSFEEASFTYRSLQARIGGERRIGPNGAIRGFLVYERVLQITPDLELDEALARGDLESERLTSLLVTGNWSLVDDALDPTRGFRLLASCEPTRADRSGSTFARLTAEAKGYLPVGVRTVLALRLKLGAIAGPGKVESVPLTRRFYAGGFDSIRGYRYHHLGPLSPSGGLLGGEGLGEASVEFRFPLGKKLRGTLFADAGNAYPEALRFTGAPTMVGTGFGIRFRTPVGPAGVDIAWKLRKDPLDESPALLHFYVGYAF